MKIAVITLKDSPNYGGILQSYALQKAIIELGHECTLIDYTNIDFKRKYTFCGKPSNMGLVYWIYKKVQYPIMYKMIHKMFPFYNHLHLTRHFDNPEELKELNSQFDAFITGSDQVWACDLNNNDDSFFLSFAEKGKLRIAYAASLGRTLQMMNVREKSFIAKEIQGMDVISVREKSDEEIISNLGGGVKTAQTVLDPTLLLNKEKWSEIAVRKKRQPYVLCYLIQSRRNDRAALAYAKKIAREREFKVIKVCRGLTSVLWGETLNIPTVEEWLGLFADASYIVTNSFHGVAFSINFNRDFNAFIEGNPTEGRNARLHNICNAVGLSNRIVVIGSNQNVDNSVINYQSVNNRLDELRAQSVEFLNNCLK